MSPDVHDPGTQRPDARRLATLLSRFDVMRRAEEQAGELRAAEGRLLWLLTDGSACRTLKQIAHDLELEQSTANRQVNAALGAGLVRRFRETGVTAWVFDTTDEGREVYARSVRRHLDRVEHALEAVPEPSRGHLLDAFEAFTRAYGDTPDDSGPSTASKDEAPSPDTIPS